MSKMLVMLVLIAAFVAWRAHKSYRRIRRGRRHDEAMHRLYLKSRGRRKIGAIFFGGRRQLRIEHRPVPDAEQTTKPASNL